MLAWKNVSRGLALLMLFVLVGAFGLVNAAQNEVTLDSDVTLEDAASCSAIGGSWADNVCTLSADSRLVINKGQTLTLLKGVRLNNSSTILNSGTITNSGSIIDNLGIITNEADGFIANEADGYIYNEADSSITNHGTITNRSASTINNSGIITNEPVGTIFNFGTFGDSTILNTGVIDNLGFIDNNSGTITNYGIIANSGTITNSGIIGGDGSGTIDNLGTIDNGGTITGNMQKRPPVVKELMCNTLNTFITQVNAGGSGLTTEQVTQLLANTDQSKTVLDCP
jgi:hypothetical protein